MERRRIWVQGKNFECELPLDNVSMVTKGEEVGDGYKQKNIKGFIFTSRSNQRVWRASVYVNNSV